MTEITVKHGAAEERGKTESTHRYDAYEKCSLIRRRTVELFDWPPEAARVGDDELTALFRRSMAVTRADQNAPRRPRPAGPTEALLLSNAGTRLWVSDVETAFRALRARAGILPRSAACRPRLHDMRHSFAVRTLLDAYRTDGDAAPKIASLVGP